MNREIKFRAWDSKNDVMRDWDYIRTNWTLNILNGDSHTEIMQFTGLRDKNGKEIYEGDIVEVWEHGNEIKDGLQKYTVRWFGEDGYPGFDLDGWEGETNGLSEIEQSGEWDIEIIGNIYENPELLSDKHQLANII